MRTIAAFRDLTRLLDDRPDAQVVEALPQDEFAWAHLPGAHNIPIKTIGRVFPSELDASRPIITYCHDALCDVSPRAATRLEQLGARDVYDYALGKMDWLAHNMAYEGDADLVSRHLVNAADVQELSVITNAEGVVTAAARGEEVEFGPSTVRPSEEREKLDARLRDRHVPLVIVTDPDGRLLGFYRLG